MEPGKSEENNDETEKMRQRKEGGREKKSE